MVYRYVVRALWSPGECHSQRADLVLIKSIHCSSVESQTRPQHGHGATQPPNIKQGRPEPGTRHDKNEYKQKQRLNRLSSTQHRSSNQIK